MLTDDQWERIVELLPSSEGLVAVSGPPPRGRGDSFPPHAGAPPSHTKPRDEPANHALGRSRGGASTKEYHACDGRVASSRCSSGFFLGPAMTLIFRWMSGSIRPDAGHPRIGRDADCRVKLGGHRLR